MRTWLDAGVSEDEVLERLQARVPEFSLSPDPGGRWDWLLGLIAVVLASGMLVALTRRSLVRGVPEKTDRDPFDDEGHWQERLDDELLESDL